jgi:hypothetical protein
MSSRRRQASDRLTQALITAASQGLRPHCSDAGSWLWLSNDPADRREAAAMCTECPVFDPCGQAAEERDERFGVWAGVDRTVTSGRKKAA